MMIFPAIDLIGGNCVRLTQGDYGQVKKYDIDPVQMAKQYAADGAGAIHVVDLDGAKAGHPANAAVVTAIAKAVKVPVQVGGGIRTPEDAMQYLDNGVARVILGTAAIETPDVVRDLVKRAGEDRVVISIDHQFGNVATRGWQAATNVPLTDCILLLRTLKVSWVVLTDIARDGMLQSVSSAQCDAVRIFAEDGFKVVAAGGVTTIEDIQQLKAANAKATIVGKALYEGHLTVKECVNVG
jgi:phosphoribosylformimino-5-aminoimidazole carboxamide ribotide isomerase